MCPVQWEVSRVESQVTVNGRACALGVETAQTNALDYLRGLGLTGAKEGCAEGECGACAVLVARPDGAGARWTALNACLMPAAALDGQEVLTAEGLSPVAPGEEVELHPVQREMAVRGGSQCGYCTPGFVCAMAAEYYRPDREAPPAGSGVARDENAESEDSEHVATEHAVAGHDGHECGPNGFDLHALSGNLCRCTGYRPIRDAAYALGAPPASDPLAARRESPAPAPRATMLATTSGSYSRPANLADALDLLAEHPGAVPVAGSTDWGVEVNLKGVRAPLVIAIDRLPELRGLTIDDDVIEIGAAVTLTEAEMALAGRVPLLAQLFTQFASRLIRNAATFGGNLGTGSPIGDSAPVLLALDADLVLAGHRGERTVPLADYFTGYRATVRAPGELIKAVRVPLPLAPLASFTKIAKRRFDDISSIAVAVALDLSGGQVRGARIGLGGVAATPIRAHATESALVGRPWDAATVSAAADVLRGEGTPLDDHRASAAYRSAMLAAALPRILAGGSPW